MTEAGYQNRRMRRLRKTLRIRQMLQQVHVRPDDLVMPLFVCGGENVSNPIASMPGCSQLSVDQIILRVADVLSVGVNAVILFGIPEYKDAIGSAALQAEGVVQTAIRAIKEKYSDVIVIADLCMCEYTDHGHCGVLDSKGVDVVNDATLELLAQQACSLAQAGADIIAPSGMMDHMVATIRSGLDSAGFQEIAIMSYAVKYASNCYGPFRDAANGAMKFGDRKTYQMDYQNIDQAYLEAEHDIAEGVDMLMVKPAQFYLDIIYRLKSKFPLPMVAYQVSGEYSMIKAAAAAGYIDEAKVVHESLVAIKRAGADLIITYFAYDYAKLWIEKNGNY